MILSGTGLHKRQSFPLLLASLLLMFFVLPATQAQEAPAPGDPLAVLFDQRLPAWMERYQVAGVNLAVIRQGKLSFTRAYGFANVETGQAMTTATPCRLESISKSLTAWGVMKLAQEGRIALDQPVGRYVRSWQLPGSPWSTRDITVGQLLSHTSGLALGTIGLRYAPGAAMPSLHESLSENARMMRAPGQAFEYSNVGYHLLELLIEEVSGHDFAGYMEEEVLKPLGMQHSVFGWREAFRPGFPLGYDATGKPVPPYVYPENASGGLISTLGDITAFVCAAMPAWDEDPGRVLEPKNITELYDIRVRRMGFYSLAFEGYGYGHLVERLPGGLTAVAHGGQGTGWMTHFHALPDSGDAIVIITNSQRSWPLFARVLSLWAGEIGLPPLGMSRIILAERALTIVLVVVLLLTLWQGVRITRQGLQGRRRLAPLAPHRRPARLLLALAAGALLAAYALALAQPYLFFTALFPALAPGLVILVPFLALVMALAALCPPGEKPVPAKG